MSHWIAVPPDAPPLVLVGASVRAAACSALHAGYRPLCADLFADADLASHCEVRRVSDNPRGIIEAVESYPDAPWIYTGGLENYPDIVDQLAARRELLGNRGDVLRRVRDPNEPGRVLADGACRFPEWRPTPEGLPCDGTWLRKGYRSAGGALVASWTDRLHPGEEAKFYYQRRINGQSLAAVFVADGRSASLLGVTEQLVGAEWTGAKPFAYAGSLGPLSPTPSLRAALDDLGNRLASEFELRGLLGVDLLLDHDQPWAVDINPRFPASVEILEMGLGFSAVALHLEACSGRLPTVNSSLPGKLFGKALLFARKQCVIEGLGPHQPDLADIPPTESTIERGHPVLTLFANADNLSDLRGKLQGKLEHWRERVGA